MSNKYIDLNSRATLLKNKLDMLSSSLQNSNSFNTKEAYMAECARVLQNFYSSLDKPFFKYEEARRDNTLLPSANSVSTDQLDYDYNLIWDQLLNNLILLFLEMENLESLSISNYNFAITEIKRLITRLKSVSSKLGDYILYSKNTMEDLFISADSFNNLTKIDINSGLLVEKECSVNQEEGIVTLPVNTKDSKVADISRIILNDDSNGFSGNNHEIGTPHNGDLAAIKDNNADTWWEYEKVVDKSNEEEPPLVLDMTLDLGSPQIVNHIILNPNNFGTRTVLTIESIDTSLDGEVMTSIKDDIPIPGYETEDEDNIFTLAPSTSQFAGQGVYTFTPRKIRYIRLTLKQSEPYVIQTPLGEKLRYAIGIRDIIAKGLKFESKGELISSVLSCPKEIRKISLSATQVPVKDSELTNIRYLISHDNGIAWNEIQPKHLRGESGVVSLPEILNFNNSDLEAIKTETGVTSLRVKMILERVDSNFTEGSSSLFKKIETASEIHGVPTGNPFTIKLEKNPQEGSVVMVDPLFGSKGLPESQYYVRHEQNLSQDSFIGLPFKNIKIPVKKIQHQSDLIVQQQPADDWLYVYVGGERWTQKGSQDWSDYDPSDTVFHFNPVEGTLEFNPDPDNGAAQPADNSPISMHFGPERLFLSTTTNNHTAELDYPTSNSKEGIIITRYENPETAAELITGNVTKFNLKHKNIHNYTNTNEGNTEQLSSNVMGAAWVDKDFLNGIDEFNSSNQYSVDKKNGIIYFSNPASNFNISYEYTTAVVLSPDDWEWTGTDLLRKTIRIKESGWKELQQSGEVFNLIGKTKFGLRHLAIVNGSFSGASNNETDPFFNFMTWSNYLSNNRTFPAATDTARQYTIDWKNGEVHLSHAYTGQVTVNYSYTKYRIQYRIAREIDASHYSVDIPNKQIVIKDTEFYKFLETPKTTKMGRAAYYLINYDYIAETREGIEELKDYFTPVIKDYTLQMLKKGILF